MNFLQIVDNRPLTEQRKKCIQSLKEKVSHHNYEVVEIPFTTPCETVNTADRIRLARAAEDPDLCYVDTDCFIASIEALERLVRRVPYFGASTYETEKGIEKHPDIFFFYVNGACDYFSTYLNESLVQDGKYSVPFEALKSLSEFRYIPEISYFHLGLTTESIIHEKEKAGLKAALDKSVLKLAALRKHIELMAITLNG